MMEWFDMGKYDFFVWTSIGVFVVALLVDALNIRLQRQQLHRTIKSSAKRKQARQPSNHRSNNT